MGSSPIRGTTIFKNMKTKKFQPIFKKYLPLAVLLVVFIAIAVSISFRPIWFDESYSAQISKGSLIDITRQTAADVHPPLYYYLLKGWASIFGYSLPALRSLSIFFSIFTLIFAFCLFRRWSKNDKVALALTAAFAFCPFFIYYATEIRMYALVCLIVLVSTYTLDLALEHRKWKYWLIYSVLIALGLYTHYFSALAFFAQLFYIIKYFIGHGFDKKVIFSYLLAIILYIPWVPTLIGQVMTVGSGFWIELVSWKTIGAFFSQSFFYYENIDTNQVYLYATIGMAILISVLIVLASGLINKSTKDKLSYITFLTFIPPATLIILSLLPFEPLYVDRYVTYSLAFLWVLVAILIVQIFPYYKKFASFMVLVMVICSFVGIYNIFHANYFESEFEKFAAYVEQNDDKKGNPIIFDGFDSDAYNMVFYETENHPVCVIDLAETWGATHPIVEDKKHYCNFDKVISDHDEFWYVVYDAKESNLSPGKAKRLGLSANLYYQAASYSLYKVSKTQK